MSRVALFQPKKGPSDEEVRQQIQKESSDRKFCQKLDKLLLVGPKTPISGGERNEHETDRGNQPSPFASPVRLPIVPPPPPLPKPASNSQSPSAPQPPSAQYEPEVVLEPKPKPEPEPDIPAFSGWVYVFENELSPYYWNMNTNTTSFTKPPDYTGELYINDAVVRPQESEGVVVHDQQPVVIVWQALVRDDGELYYLNIAECSISTDRPIGDVFIVTQGVEGDEETWQECVTEDNGVDSVCYINLATDEATTMRPAGITIIVQST